MSKNLIEQIKKKGLWDNIWAKRKRISQGSGEKMRKPGSEGAPTTSALKKSQVKEEHDALLNAKTPTPKQIAHKFKRPVEQIRQAIAKGQKVEKEHTTDPKIAREIATDHVNERPDYYDALKRIEKNKLKEAFNDRKDIISSLKDTGFEQQQGTRGGDHELWKHPSTGKTVAVPRHKTVSSGVANKILKTIKQHNVKEAFETSEKQSKNKNDASSRFDGTTSATNVYKSGTPGERARKIKSIIRSIKGN